jgi:ABC-2 type transport system ATP-binding protein
MTDMIAARGLTKEFERVLAVDRVTFSVQSGEVFGLLGPNGAGKTTTIRMLAALIGPTSGEAEVAGRNVLTEGREVRRNIGILTESPGLYDGLSAARNLDFFARMYEVDDPAAQVERYLRMLGLWGRRHELVSTFSKGMRQKLAIARALLHEPKVVFLDEPTSGLDPQMARLVREFIGELKDQGRTIVLSTHNLDEADRLCDRIGVLKSRLLALDTPQALRQQMFGRTVVFHLGQPAVSAAGLVSAMPFVLEAQAVDAKLVVRLDDPESHNPAIIAALVEANVPVQFVGEVRRSLEDIYLHVHTAGNPVHQHQHRQPGRRLPGSHFNRLCGDVRRSFPECLQPDHCGYPVHADVPDAPGIDTDYDCLLQYCRGKNHPHPGAAAGYAHYNL